MISWLKRRARSFELQLPRLICTRGAPLAAMACAVTNTTNYLALRGRQR